MYEIVRYGAALKSEIVALQRHLWGDDVLANTAYFQWKYEQNPYLEEPLVYLAVENGHVVGMRGMYGSLWEVGTPPATFVIPAADDLVIAPDHRARGLFARIMRAAFDDLAGRSFTYAFSLSPGPVTLASSLATGWRAAGSMRSMRRETWAHKATRRVHGLLRKLPAGEPSVDAAARSLVRAVGHHPFRTLDRGGPRHRPIANISVEEAPRVAAMADLVRRIDHDGRLRHVRDEVYFTWRFRNPRHDYRFLFRGEDRLEGYLVLQAVRDGRQRVVNIVDVEGTSAAIRAELLSAAIEWGRFPNVMAWTATMPQDLLVALRTEGFVLSDHGPLGRYMPSVLVRTVRDDQRGTEPMLGGRRLLDLATWDMRMIYSMAG